MQNYKIDLLGIAGVVTAGSVAYSIWANRKMSKMANKLNLSIDDFSRKNVTVDISDIIVENAVRCAAEKKAAIVVNETANEALRYEKNEIKSRIHSVVETEYDSIKDDVLERVKTEVTKLDEERLCKDVRADAKKEIASRLEGELKDISEEYRAARKTAQKQFESKLKDILKKYDDDLSNALKVIDMIKNPKEDTSTSEVINGFTIRW